MQDVIEVAKSGRARCRTCREKIDKGSLRFGEEEFNTFSSSGGTTYRWHHLECAARSKGRKLKPVLEAYSGPVPERAKLDTILASGGKPRGRAFPYAEVSPSGRSSCLECDSKIPKDAVRIAVAREIDTGSFAATRPGYLHVQCADAYVQDPDLLDDVLTNSVALSDASIAVLEESLG